jgi:mono/diheme cytochrome c family protein
VWNSDLRDGILDWPARQSRGEWLSVYSTTLEDYVLKLSAIPSSLRHAGGVLVMILLGLPLASGAAQAQADGARMYATVCSSCHQASGEGVPGAFPPLAESEWVTGDEGRLVKIILHGLQGEIDVAGEMYAGMMPPWGSLKDDEIAVVATYVRSNFGNDAPAVTTATVTRIRAESSARKTPWTVEELVLSTAAEK